MKRAPVILAFTSIAAGLLIGEVLLRYAGIYASYSEKNNHSSYQSPYQPQEIGWLHTYAPYTKTAVHSNEFQHFVNCNSLGLNDREWPLHKTKPMRIACIGDSFTEGVGAPADSTYSALLEKQLDSAEVLNCGVSGSDPLFAYILLKKKLLVYHPDIVFVTVNGTDIFEVVSRGGMERFKDDGTTSYKKAPWWEPLYAHCYLFRLMLHKVLGYNRFLQSTESWKISTEKAFKTLNSGLDDIQTLCSGNGIRCIFVFNPLRYEMLEGKLECTPVMNYANQKGYETIDLKRSFEQKGLTPSNIQEFYWTRDTHNTPKGYTVFAEAMADKIRDKMILAGS